MRKNLTPRQAAVLAAIRDLRDRGEPAPTYRELCVAFGWSSTGTARDHLRALERKGYVELPRGRAHRQIRLREEAPAAARIPLLGRVVAGTPLHAEQNAEGRIPVPGDWVDGRPHFALRVAGDSMVDAGILDGDRVVVRQQVTARDGEIVVVTLNGETTLKRLRRRGGRVELVAENPRYPPIEIRTESAMLHGVVVGLLRTYAGSRSREASREERKRTIRDDA